VSGEEAISEALSAGGFTMNGDFTSHMAASGVGASWRPIDLSAAVLGGRIDPEPELLRRDDDRLLIYRGRIHAISGESESLKTWLVLMAVAEVIAASGHALFIDYEDSADGIVSRLLALGCPGPAVLDHFSYVRPVEPYGPAAESILAASLSSIPVLAVLDGITEAMASHGLDPLSNADVAKFSARLPVPLAASGSAVVMIDHVPKSKENRGRYAIGAQHKLAVITGASYIVELVKPFGHGLHGMSKIIVAKDRPGRVRQHSPGSMAGLLHLQSEADGSVTAHIEGPGAAHPEAGIFRPTTLMERTSQVIESKPGLTARAIRGAVKGNNEAKQLALELLIAEGFVQVNQMGRSRCHFSLMAYRPGDPE
jgi:hypothetical protein